MRHWRFLPILFSQAAVACGEDAAPANVMSWFKMNHETIEIAAADDGGHVSYAVDMAPNQDMRIKATMSDKKQTSHNEFMLISGNLLVKGDPLHVGYEIDAIDEVSLTLQLVNQLLAAGTQKSPGEIKTPTTMSHTETKRSLCVATMSASGEYSTPWTIKGDATPKSHDDIDFHFTFASASTGKTEADYRGEWRQDAKAVVFADDMPIEDWKLYRIGPIQKREGNSTILDYGASANSHRYATLGELRKALESKQAAPEKGRSQ